MNRLKRVKIDEQNISELLRQIILTIPNLKDEIGSIIGVQLRYLPKNDSFQTMNDIGQAMTETIISVTPDNTVGIRKVNHVLHTIYAPKIYPIRENVDLIVPVEILQAYGTLFQTDIVVIRYIFSLLHELGYIQLGITRPGHPADLLLAISNLMDAFDDYEHENYEVSEDNMRRRYRENYAELYADSFAYKWLPIIMTKINPAQYFSKASKCDIRIEENKFNEGEGLNMDENLQFWLDGIRQMISVEELWAKHAPTKTDVETHQMTTDRLKTLKTFLEENTK